MSQTLQHKQGSFNPFDAHCCHLGTAQCSALEVFLNVMRCIDTRFTYLLYLFTARPIKHRVSDRVEPSFVIFDIRAL